MWQTLQKRSKLEYVIFMLLVTYPQESTLGVFIPEYIYEIMKVVFISAYAYELLPLWRHAVRRVQLFDLFKKKRLFFELYYLTVRLFKVPLFFAFFSLFFLFFFFFLFSYRVCGEETRGGPLAYRGKRAARWSREFAVPNKACPRALCIWGGEEEK